MRPPYFALAACGLLMHAAFAGPLIESREDKNVITGRASMLGRFEPIVNSVVVPFLVATGVVSLVRMVPGVMSSLPGMFGFAKRTGFEVGEQYPKEFYDIMTMLDNAAVKYGQQHGADPTAAAATVQRQPVASASQQYQYQYQQYLQQLAQAQASQQQAAQVAQAQAQSGQKTHATARQHQG